MHEVLIWRGMWRTKFEIEDTQTRHLNPEERLTLMFSLFNFFSSLGGASISLDSKKLVEIIAKLAQNLNKSGFSYAIIGNAAAAIYGRPLSTADVDILIDYHADEAEKLSKTIVKAGFDVNVNDLKQALSNKAHATALLKPLPYFRLDIIPIRSERERREVKEAKSVDIIGIKVKVATIEDLIPYLILYERFESAAFLITKYSKGLDWKHVRVLSKKLGVYNKLKELMRK